MGNKTLAAQRLKLLKKWKKARKVSHDPSNLRLSEDGLNLIKSFEGYFPAPYNDPVGHATIGYGHLLHYGKVTEKDRRKWGRITEKEAATLLAQDLNEKYEPYVRGLPRKLTQGQYDAIVSFIYNLGPGVLGTGYTFGRQLRKNHNRAAANAMLLYVKAGNPAGTLSGLVRRRRAERKLFLS